MRYGAVVLSPVSVLFVNASNIGANQATSKCLRGVIDTVALIVLWTCKVLRFASPTFAFQVTSIQAIEELLQLLLPSGFGS